MSWDSKRCRCWSTRWLAAVGTAAQACTGAVDSESGSGDGYEIAPRAAEYGQIGSTETALRPGADAFLEDLGVSCKLRLIEGTSQIEMTLENQGDLELDILGRGTAWDLGGNVFSVLNDGKKLRYQGIIAYRLPPADTEFLSLSPGKLLSTTYDVAHQYRVKEEGDHKIALRSRIIKARMGTTELRLQHNCGILNANLTHGTDSTFGQAKQAFAFSPGTGCSNSDKALLDAMDKLAQITQDAALSYPYPYDSPSPIFERWFGAWDYDNAAYVAYIFETVSNLQNSPGFDADCRQDPPPTFPYICTASPGRVPNTAAWVDGGADDGVIHACDPFLANAAGLVSEVGPGLASILLHEKVHLASDSVIDLERGGPNCKQLALDSPEDAVFNADSYAFFSADNYLTRFVLPVLLVPLD